ncbi:siderophore biosynthesis protein [Planomonospora parontospora]|uniref:siderophore biosynthesis protein n=1 Tax=Planomonospora parontospora TaxID=58119 RepID=UPI0016716F9E|nr:siderophore biosynthesis protein [Planomonospora parontospora]GGL10067.1 carboxylate--amine ligase [Planomonospora parontospora subsp. antibiotica]GII14702.1 carboxylate--amine ligase [Planomonospora parontospora subsp. antibiotica]
MRLYLTALKPTDSVADGFLPAARALGCDVTVLTDRPEQYAASGAETLACDVRDARAVIDVIAHHHPPAAVFSNSDHIQAETALAAAYFDLPGKDWRACVAAKNKALTRRRLAAAGVEAVRSVRLAPDAPVPGGEVPLPAVVKPSQGVASEDVVLVRDGRELAGAVRAIRGRRPGETLVVEEYLDGPLHTLETLGDGRVVRVLGGFRTTLGPLPHFVEERLDWEPPPAAGHVLRALQALGVGFGACHTEYVMTADGPRIIEVNYRVIGDHCDFLLADLLGVPLFERILGVHLGLGLGPDLGPDPGPERATARGTVHGTALSLVAERSGTVTRAPGIVAPSPGDRVRLWHRPLRSVGDRIDRSHTNRDYLGVVRAVGPDRASVDEAVSAFTAADPWVIA